MEDEGEPETKSKAGENFQPMRGNLWVDPTKKDWVWNLELKEKESKWASLPWQERLTKGGCAVPPEFEEKLKELTAKTMKMSFEELCEVERELPAGHDAEFWQQLSDEYWEEASKEIDQLLEKYEMLDAEVEYVENEKKAIDAMFPGDDTWLWEVNRRRRYWQATNQVDEGDWDPDTGEKVEPTEAGEAAESAPADMGEPQK